MYNEQKSLIMCTIHTILIKIAGKYKFKNKGFFQQNRIQYPLTYVYAFLVMEIFKTRNKENVFNYHCRLRDRMQNLKSLRPRPF